MLRTTYSLMINEVDKLHNVFSMHIYTLFIYVLIFCQAHADNTFKNFEKIN